MVFAEEGMAFVSRARQGKGVKKNGRRRGKETGTKGI